MVCFKLKTSGVDSGTIVGDRKALAYKEAGLELQSSVGKFFYVRNNKNHYFNIKSVAGFSNKRINIHFSSKWCIHDAEMINIKL